MGWAVIVTKPGAELTAEKAIEDAGYPIYFPRYRKLLRGVKIVRGRKVRTRGPGEIVERMVFPGYGFLVFDPSADHHGLTTCPGVAGLLRTTPSAPLYLLPDHEVAALRARVESGEFDDKAIVVPRPVAISKGDIVRVDSEVSELRDLVLHVDSVDDKGRVFALVDMLGRCGVPVTIDPDVPLVVIA